MQIIDLTFLLFQMSQLCHSYVPVLGLVITSLSTSTMQDIHFLVNNVLHCCLRIFRRTFPEDCCGQCFRPTGNCKHDYTNYEQLLPPFTFYTMFTEKSQNARHAINLLQCISMSLWLLLTCICFSGNFYTMIHIQILINVFVCLS